MCQYLDTQNEEISGRYRRNSVVLLDKESNSRFGQQLFVSFQVSTNCRQVVTNHPTTCSLALAEICTPLIANSNPFIWEKITIQADNP